LEEQKIDFALPSQIRRFFGINVMNHPHRDEKRIITGDKPST
jgi:hypothetical protein